MLTVRRRVWIAAGLFLFVLYRFYIAETSRSTLFSPSLTGSNHVYDDGGLDADYFWRKIPTNYPVASMRSFPTGRPLALPRVQAEIEETAPQKQVRVQRQGEVKKAFQRCWQAYERFAMPYDELTPITGKARNTFGGWGATLVDSLDSLWIMSCRGFHDEFERAVSAAANVSFDKIYPGQINTFETAIRYLGGLLSAYDLSQDERLLVKAREVGHMLYKAFDTPNRMPISRWDISKAAAGNKQEASAWVLLAEIGSLSMEFTRLSLVTGNPKWFDATERITDVLREQQGSTKLPGLWPLIVNPRRLQFNQDGRFSLGAMADSAFEYLPKMYALSGGLLPHYQQMYESAMDAAMKYNFFRPMVPDEADILLSGIVRVEEDKGGVPELEYKGEHLVCFVGGMLALGGKLFSLPEHLEKGRKITNGCIWTYQQMPSGIMPEVFYMSPCESETDCPWDELGWKQSILKQMNEDPNDTVKADSIINWKGDRLPKGFTRITDPRYILRPEAIESVFVLYRTTGDRKLLEDAWQMFQSIQMATETHHANAALEDVTLEKSGQVDSMESFWLGETLKYFYLIFSELDVISLDEYVFNTEAHPFKRLVPEAR